VNGEDATSMDSAAAAPLPPEGGGEDAARQEIRSRIMMQFERWLDRMLTDEPPPTGVPAELLAAAHSALGEAPPADASADLYALFSALTTLTGEIRLQGRTFKQMTDGLGPMMELPERLERLESAQVESAVSLDRLCKQVGQQAGDGSLPPSKQVLSVLFDLHERLERGLKTLQTGIESLRGEEGGWLARMTGSAARVTQALDVMDAMQQGHRLTLARLEAALQEWSIERIGESGDAFDPQSMTVVDVGPGNGAPDGTVLEVYRSGYVLHGQLLAAAQVKVAKE
jgi:hypothetical protein